MQNDSQGDINNIPTDRGVSIGRHARGETSGSAKNQSEKRPRARANARTAGCAPPARRPVGQSAPTGENGGDPDIRTDGSGRVTCPRCGEAVSGFAADPNPDHVRIEPCGHVVRDHEIDVAAAAGSGVTLFSRSPGRSSLGATNRSLLGGEQR